MELCCFAPKGTGGENPILFKRAFTELFLGNISKHSQWLSPMSYEKQYFMNQKVSEKLRPYHLAYLKTSGKWKVNSWFNQQEESFHVPRHLH